MTMEDMGDELNEILEEFFTEADENIDTIEQDLIKLEALAEDGDAGTDQETVDRIFRMLHTLKGGAGFLGLEKIAKLAHAGENLLDEVRQGRVQVTKPVMDALLQTTDVLKQLIVLQKRREDDSGLETDDLKDVLEALASGQEVEFEAPAPKPLEAKTEIPASLMEEVLADPSLSPERDKEAETPVAAPVEMKPAVTVNSILMADVLNDPALNPELDKGEEVAVAPAKPVKPAAPVARGAVGPVIVKAPAPEEQRKGEDRRQGPRRNEEGNDTIRVETARLDKVMNLVGELVLARNTMQRQLGSMETRMAVEALENGARILSTMEQLSRVTQDLQMSVLSTRMQPIKKVFDKIPRQVRELKTQLKKDVNLIIEGEMTEVDKSLVEDLADPMVHMIRNALDHGLETPKERTAAGKHPEGTLVVRAFYEGNNVVIQVQEDGRGIDPEVIKRVAVKKGVITQEAADMMGEAEAIRLIMAPGFSTAEKVTDVSGRGVGMDVVNTKIVDLKGSIDIRSETGVGTCFSIYMPLTLAIVNALIVGAKNEGFAIPIGDIAEVIKFSPEAMHRVNNRDVIELRGETLPLYYLNSLTRELKLHQPDGGSVVASMAAEGAVMPGMDDKAPAKGFVVVVREGGSAMGLVVDTLLGQEEVVVKQVSGMFEYNRAISGATITGDGKVHMILDVPYLMKELGGASAR